MKSRFKPNQRQVEEARARRAALSARSAPLQAARKAGLLPWSALPTLNACLELIYSAETGETDFATFYTWKERGFSLDKGAKGFALWGKPKFFAPADDNGPAVDVDESDPTGKQWWPMSYIFHAGQVSDAAGNRPGRNIISDALDAARRMPLALEYRSATVAAAEIEARQFELFAA